MRRLSPLLLALCLLAPAAQAEIGPVGNPYEYKPEATPKPKTTPEPKAAPKTSLILTIRFDRKRTNFEPSLRQAIAAAEASRRGRSYDVVGTGAGGEDNAQAVKATMVRQLDIEGFKVNTRTQEYGASEVRVYAN